MKKTLIALVAAIGASAYAGDNWVSISGEPVKNATNLCWRDANWTPATAHPDCDGALKQPAVRVAAKVNTTVPVTVLAQRAPIVPEAKKIIYGADAFFDFDKAVIKPEGKEALAKLAESVANISLEVIIAVGHTDSVGTDKYNMKLGQRRAEAVRSFLISQGLEKNRVYTESKGESQPVADNKTSAGRAKNRRVVIEVIGTVKN